MKLIEIELPKSYTFFDNQTGHIIGPTEDMLEFAKEADSYCIRQHGAGFFSMVTPYSDMEVLEVKTRITVHNWYLHTQWAFPIKVKNVYVTDERGNVIDFAKEWQLNRARIKYPYKWKSQHYLLREERDDAIRANLVIKKHNKDKIKAAYNTKVYHSNYDDRKGYYCTTRSIARVKTQAEHRKIAGVEKEDFEPEFRGKRRNLPNAWDDKKVGIFYNYKSWKHNSKRRKQWKE